MFRHLHNIFLFFFSEVKLFYGLWKRIKLYLNVTRAYARCIPAMNRKKKTQVFYNRKLLFVNNELVFLFSIVKNLFLSS